MAHVRSFPWINHNNLGTACLPRFRETLKQNRVTPRKIRSHEYDEIRFLQIFITSGHRVRAKRAAMPCNRRRHTESRVRVDIGRPDKTLHQLVGDVIVFGQKLTGNIESNGLRPMLADRVRELLRHQSERGLPIGLHAVDRGLQ